MSQMRSVNHMYYKLNMITGVVAGSAATAVRYYKLVLGKLNAQTHTKYK
jgi:hypothetical protein